MQEPGVVIVVMATKRQPGHIRPCEVCGGVFVLRKLTQRTCSARCRNALTSRESAERRGDLQRGRGEGRTYRKLRGRHEHRVLAERKLGRALRSGEIVHHRDEDRRNNAESNLEILPSQAEHARLHSTKNRVCDLPGCVRRHYAKGLCSAHYQSSRREVNANVPG